MRKYQKGKAKNVFGRAYTIIVIALIFSEAMVLGANTADPLTVAETDRKEIDLLFQKLGVLALPDRTLPVEIILPDPDGRIISISEFRGKIVLLNFWASWCFPCIIEMPAMENLHKRLKRRNFVMVAINLQESAEQVKQFFKDNKLTFTTLLDTKGIVGTEFGIRSIPTTFILDKEGRLIGKALGPREWNGKDANALFDYLVDERPMQTSESKN
jgi:thiol-disulfide isomerase/thioredoxin